MKRLAALSIMISVVLGLLPAAHGAELPTFTDVPAGSWFEQGILTCAQNGIMVGRGENIFAPEATLTDAECLMLAYRLYDQAKGGDGSLLKMPDDYGYIRIVSDDGSVVREGYAGDRSLWTVPNIHYSSEGYRLCLVGYSAAEELKAGTATLTFDGKEYRGTLQSMFRGSGRYEQDRFFGFEPEDSALNRLMVEACYDTAPPTLWWADLLYTIDQKGWRETFGSYCLLFGSEESRGSFADLLGTVTNLPKRFDVPSIPDLGERGETGSYSDHIYGLYEAGVLGGVDTYGTFDVEKTLTRAEAATMVTRILDESQRLTTPPGPMPKEGERYTLTYLRDGVFSDLLPNDTYPYCVVGECEEGSSFALPVGLLTLEGEYTPWTNEMEEQVKVPYGWRNWGGLEVESGGRYYRWKDGSPATEKFDFCGKIGPDGRGFVQKDGKLYHIQFDLASEKAVIRPERPTVPMDAAEGMGSLYDFKFYDRYDAKVERDFSLTGWDEERETGINYALLMAVEGALEGATAESIDGNGLTPYQLKRYKQESLDGDFVLGVHSYPLDGIEYISYIWTERPSVVTDWNVGVGTDESELVWRYSRNLRLIEKDAVELDWMSSHSSRDFDELYVWQPFTPESNDCRDITFYMKDRKVVAVEMTAPMELRYVYGHDKDEELRQAEQRRQTY